MPADKVKAKHFTVVFYIYMQSELERNILLMKRQQQHGMFTHKVILNSAWNTKKYLGVRAD